VGAMTTDDARWGWKEALAKGPFECQGSLQAFADIYHRVEL
jgi:hypothetical protein